MTTSTSNAVDQAFIDVILADDDLANAEFEAIIAAEWPTTEPPEPAGHPHRTYGSRRPHARRNHEHRARSQRPGTEAWSRERSPPSP